MKRKTGKRDPNHESDDDGSASDSSMRRRRRRRQMENNDMVNANTPREHPCITGLALTAPQKVPVTTNTKHDIDKIVEHVFLPDYVREHNSTLTFPEKLMLTLTHVDRERSRKGIPESGESLGWVLDGTAFVVQNIDQLCVTWLPLFFGQSKFSSFTRKLYRWGFRKINVASIPNSSSYRENALFFGNEHFLRSDKSQLSLMRSVTAAKTRSGTVGPLSRIVPPTSESTLSENVPHEVPVDVSRSYPPQIPIAPVNAVEDMASLIQQSVNLQSLLALLSSNQAGGGAVFNQPPPLLNPTFADSMNSSFLPPQVAPALATDMNQMLQQLSVSAALLRASGAIQTLPPVVPIPVQTPVNLPPNIPIMPWWMNGSIPTGAQPPSQLLSHPQLPGLPNIVNAVANLQQQTPHNLAEQERLRGVVDTFVRYCSTVQQQQGAPRPPPPPPSDERRPS